MLNSSSNINVLLADDDQDDCLIFKDALDELRLPVSLKMVPNGEELLKRLKSIAPNLPDILFLDLNMPRKNGFECLVEIKEHPDFKKLPVVIYSTSYDEEKANMLEKQGASHYIRKPIDFEELKNVILRAIEYVIQKKSPGRKESFFINELK